MADDMIDTVAVTDQFKTAKNYLVTEKKSSEPGPVQYRTVFSAFIKIGPVV